MNEQIQRLEEKVAYLERHVVSQDKAMLDLAHELTRIRREWKALRERLATGAEIPAVTPIDSRPPHY